MNAARAFTVVGLAAFATGVLGLATGTRWDALVLFVHGASGIATVVLAPWKPLLRARHAISWRALLTTLSVTVIAASGMLHATGLWVGRGGYAALTVHVATAVVFVAALAGDAILRRARGREAPERMPVDARRQVLRAGVGVAAALAGRGVLDGLISVSGLDGENRRFTGSFEVGSFDPQRMPRTNWLNDEAPLVDLDHWSLRVSNSNIEKIWLHEDLLAASEDVEATIDCTGGWYSTQSWSAVRLDTLAEGLSGRCIEVRSLTGYSRCFPRDDAEHLWLALRAGNAPLSRGHGHPARLVAPGRRGFWWVKWVGEIRVSGRPWWLQSPFPLQ